MNRARRYDRGAIAKAHRTPEGYLCFEGRATRAGVFLYRNLDGTIRRELRPPDEVGRADSLGTLARKPVTDLHPDDFVTAENADELAVGIVDPVVVWESDFADGYVKVRGTIQRKSAVDSIDEGRVELSCGYTARIDFTPGVWTDAAGVDHEYDSVQRDIEYNHLALVDRGRAGKLARLRADDAISLTDSEAATYTDTTHRESDMKTITIRGRAYNLDSEQPAIQRAIADMEGEMSEMEPGEKAAKLMLELEELKVKLAALEVANADMGKKLEGYEAGEGEGEGGEGEGEMMSVGDAMAWAFARLELVDFAHTLGVEGAEDMLDVTVTDADIKRKVALTRFDADDLPTEAHVDAAVSLIRKDGEGKARAKAKAKVEPKNDGLTSSTRRLTDMLFKGRKTTKADEADERKDEGSELDEAQAEYDKKFGISR